MHDVAKQPNALDFMPVKNLGIQRLRQTGKPPKLAFIAVARKILVALNAIARERTAWNH